MLSKLVKQLYREIYWNMVKNDCFAPVLSQLELQLLITIAAQKKCIPKSGDIVQAFCQSYLPEGENYIC